MITTQVLFGYPLPEPPWSLALGVYFILSGLASGIALLCWWLRPRDPRTFAAFEWQAGLVAMAAMIVALFILIWDLGQPARFFLMVTEFDNLGSPMSVGAKIIAAKTFFLGLYLYIVYRQRHGLAKGVQLAPAAVSRALGGAVPVLLGMTSLGLAIYPAYLLSQTWISPLASSPGASLSFLSTAMLMGAAVAVIVAVAWPDSVDEELRIRLGRTLLFLVAAETLLILAEGLLLTGGRPEISHALHVLITGQSATVFWGLVITMGLAVPLVGLLAFPRHRLAMMVSATGALVGAGAARFLIFAIH